jgi:CRP-like cAMP-binding protein
MTENRSENLLLAALPAEEIALLRPLTLLPLREGERIARAGDVIEQAIFPRSGAVSLQVATKAGGEVEAAMIGPEGGLGTPITAGMGRSMNDVVVQVSGSAYGVPLPAFQDALPNSPKLRERVARFEAVLMAQVQQAAACNATHPTLARMCRWLLELRERHQSDLIPMTHDLLARMIGVQRTTVTLLATNLQEMGAIRCRRGKIQILDVAKLEHTTCECYGRMRAYRNEASSIPTLYVSPSITPTAATFGSSYENAPHPATPR